jgi:hypothetical protein
MEAAFPIWPDLSATAAASVCRLSDGLVMVFRDMRNLFQAHTFVMGTAFEEETYGYYD